ncbi:DEAD/DEAH box helicase [Alteromonas mediterranea]|uniref:DEAD/DEAH box helicase n=1 Tax=Alteromonas mediterranea TaxID=314275 RepID=UPI0032B1FAC1|tara:strand:+ start:3706 stop:5055 length:1350 start_codon:yes stop_codon:yes gene_type:complete
MLDRNNLHAYQHKAVEFIKDSPKAALWIDMGLGKTVSTLTALSDLLDDKTVKQTLVIAPLRVATHTWPTEIANWSHIDIRYTVLAGLTPKQREAAAFENTPLHIINREMIPWLVELLGQRWHYDCVIIDESSSFKSHTSKRWKSLRKVIGKINRMVQLTGTPAPNALLELWPQMYLLDKGKRLENTRGKFLSKYCTMVGNPQWNQWAVKPDRAEAIHKAVSDVVLRMKADDYIDLPQRIDINVPVVLPPKARKAYNDMKRDFLLSYDKGEVLALNAAVQINKLLQMANGNLYTEDGDFISIHYAKLDALTDIINAASEPVLIAYSYRSDLEILMREFPDAVVIDNDNAVLDRWNAGEIPILLAHPASAGHGLNLQKGGSLIVWYGLSWSLELYQQFNARLHRQGQTKPVRILHILTENTADDAVLSALLSKTETQDTLLNVVESLRDQK